MRPIASDQADRKYAVSDGAEWIRRQYQRQLPDAPEARIRLLSLPRSHRPVRQTLFGEGTDAAMQWREAFCTKMRQSGPVDALTDLALLRQKHRGGKGRPSRH